MALRPAPGVALRALVTWLLDALADALAERLQVRDERERDPNWGMVSQKTLPAWIHPEAYVDAARAGKIEGARLWRRQWIAPREAVERWWLAESKEPDAQNDNAHDPESAEGILAAAGFVARDAAAGRPEVR